MIWQQIYDPFGSMVVSTALAAVPVVVMLVGLGFLHLKAHVAAGAGLLAAIGIAILAYGMPAEMAGKAAMLGGFTSLLPIGWIVLNMQRVAADRLGLSPNLMGAANSSGGVMGKMIDAQSIVVASTATGWFNHEGDILRYVFFHSLALACLVGMFVTLQAYVYPFTSLVIR